MVAKATTQATLQGALSAHGRISPDTLEDRPVGAALTDGSKTFPSERAPGHVDCSTTAGQPVAEQSQLEHTNYYVTFTNGNETKPATTGNV